MKKTATIFSFLFLAIFTQAQYSFKTMVPQQPVVAGESFQVQYVIEDGDKTMNVKPPLFTNFRFVAGPNVYRGTVATVNGGVPLQNVVYTLEATRPGRFMIPGASITVNGKTIRSNDVMIEVISKEEAFKKLNKENGVNPSDYFLRPGENPYEKIRRNLFVKLVVNKKTCFVGEPVLATFKLYSRLESKSDIIKNPGFYGFTVYDMLNLADKQVATEKINGKAFDVHTIRKVQLYPLQAGVFTVDAMQVSNKVEFSRSAVNKKTEQEIVEGVLGKNENVNATVGTDVFETEISTEPVAINVKPVPEKNRPAAFDGATGHFSVAAGVIKSKLSKNEEGVFEITISGKGNFIQISAPAVQWPAGIESFEPSVKDNLDKTATPLSGSRIFRYPFVCTVPGTYLLPSVSIPFFDTDSNTYKTVSTKAVTVAVGNEDKKSLIAEEHKVSIAEKSEKAARMAGIIVVSLVLLVLIYWIFRKKEPETLLIKHEELSGVSVETLLQPADAVVSSGGSGFYSTLHGIIWKFAAEQFGLSGSEMSKQALIAKMQAANINSDITQSLFRVLELCEAGMFTSAELAADKYIVLQEAKEVLDKMSSSLTPGNLL
ncbi:MAG: BatD family protein [Bacteroidota bacterium]